jgi:ABC-2 type transport system permease protein
MKDNINENMESLLNINEDIGYLMDHRTLRLLPQVPQGGYKRPDAVSNLRPIITETYNLKYVKLSEGPIPESLNCLIMAAPQEPFTDYELFLIDQYLMRGKNLAIFVDGYIVSQEEGKENTYYPLDLGLNKLLEHYGLRVKHSMVMDESCLIERRPAEEGGGQIAIHFVPIIKNEFINKDLKFMRNIKGLAVSYDSPLELISERIAENGLKANRVFSSSDKSWEMSGEEIFIHPLLIKPPESEDEFMSQPLAYVLEGKFTSYFAGKQIPEKPESDSKKTEKGEEGEEKPDVDLSKIETSGEILTEGKPGKIFFIASSGVLKDNILDTKGENTNSTFIVNVLDYLNNREDIAVMRSKLQGFNPLHDTEVGTKIFVKFFNIAGLPMLIVLFGLMVWLYRHSRKKRIKMMFQK